MTIKQTACLLAYLMALPAALHAQSASYTADGGNCGLAGVLNLATTACLGSQSTYRVDFSPVNIGETWLKIDGSNVNYNGPTFGTMRIVNYTWTSSGTHTIIIYSGEYGDTGCKRGTITISGSPSNAASGGSINGGGTQVICEDDTPGSISLSLSGNHYEVLEWQKKPLSSGSWAGIAGTASVVLTSGKIDSNNSYEYRAKVNNTCSSAIGYTATPATVTVHQKPNTPTIDSSEPHCRNYTLVGQKNIKYTFTPGGYNQTANSDGQVLSFSLPVGTYTISGSNVNCSYSTNFSPQVTIYDGSAQAFLTLYNSSGQSSALSAVCDGNGFYLQAGSSSSTNPNYRWYRQLPDDDDFIEINHEGSPVAASRLNLDNYPDVLTPDENEQAVLKVTYTTRNDCGQDKSVAKTINLNVLATKTPFLDISPASPGTVCEGAVLNLTANPWNYWGSVTGYSWSDSQGTISGATGSTLNYTVNQTETITVTVTFNGSCMTSTTAIKSVNVDVHPIPGPATMPPFDQICPGDTPQLEVSNIQDEFEDGMEYRLSSKTTSFTSNWQPGSADYLYFNSIPADEYWLQGRNENVCATVIKDLSTFILSEKMLVAPTVYDGENDNCGSPDELTLSAATLNRDPLNLDIVSHTWFTSSNGVGTVTPNSQSIHPNGDIHSSYTVIRTEQNPYPQMQYWVAAIDNEGCERGRTMVQGNFLDNDPTITAWVSGSSELCEPATFTLKASGGEEGSVYKWYETETGGTPISLPPGSDGSEFQPTLNFSDMDPETDEKKYYVGGTLISQLGCSIAVDERTEVTVKAKFTPLPPFAEDQTRHCAGDVTFNSSAAFVKWYDANENWLADGNTYTATSLTAESTSFKLTRTADGCESDFRTVTATVTYPPDPTANDIEVFGAGQVTMIASGAEKYNWYDASGTTQLASDTEYYTTEVSNSTSFIVKSYYECESLNGVTLNVDVYPVPQVTLSGSNFIDDPQAPQFALSNTTGLITQWLHDNLPVSAPDGTWTDQELGSYKVKATTPNNRTYVTPATRIYQWANSSDAGNDDLPAISEDAPATGTAVNNYVRTYSPREAIDEINKDDLDLVGLNGTTPAYTEEELLVATQYIDGLGRGVQGVSWKGSPGKKDLVSPVAFDNLGRQPRQYLPYASGTDDNGGHKANALLEQYNFYQDVSGNDEVANAQNPYASVKFEASPLSRVLEQAGPGESWYPGLNWDFENRKTVKFRQRSNRYDVDGDLIRWKKSGELLTRDGTWADNALAVSEVTDEHDTKTLEFTDKDGQTVLKRVQGDKNNWLDTYYVYDDFGNQVFIIPPQAWKEIDDNGYTDIGPVPDNYTRVGSDLTLNSVASPASYYYDPGVKVSMSSGFSFTYSGSGDGFRITGGTLEEGLHYDYLFVYEYDDHQRLIAKKVPGAHWEYFVYDQWDQLIMTQTGNQLENEQWSFIKYDEFGRPAVSGVVTLTGLDLSTVRANADAAGRFVDYDAISNDYDLNSNSTYPAIVANDVLAKTYYDDYDFLNGWTGSWSFQDEDGTEGVYPDANHANVLGLATGGMTKLLDGSGGWIKSVTYYDHKYRPIQAKADNILGGIDRVTNVYSFSGNLEQSLQYHDPTGTLDVVQTTRYFDYDHADRLLWVDHETTIGAQNLPRTRLATFTYNELGEVIEKNLHSEDGGTNHLQSVDYKYNIRGWLTDINDPNLSVEGDLLGIKLNYDRDQGHLSFNGNISGMQWQTAGGEKAMAYGFLYDELNRIRMADYGAGASFGEDLAKHEMRINEYDLNGNIRFLDRGDPANSSRTDDLGYTYQGNQLVKVDDSGSANDGFKNGASATTEYQYDRNGNMLDDQNKGITSITYNHLNLPQTVILSEAGGSEESRFEYTYDASGIKLKQETYVDDVLQTTIYYAGDFLYLQEGANEKQLSFIHTEEGRLVNEGLAGYRYQYFLTDHLGNVRLTFTEEADTWNYDATMEPENATLEEALFTNLAETRQLDNATAYEGDNSSRLNAYQSRIVGPGITFQLGKDDVVNMEVWAMYTDASNTNATTSGLVTAVQSAFGLTATGETAQAFQAINDALGGATPLFAFDQNPATPDAYLNYLFFDQQYELVTAGYQQVSTEDIYEKLSISYTAEKAGYIYIYLANETQEDINVFFDNLAIEHIETPVIQSDDFYPFGLTMAETSYLRELKTQNDYLYQGKERMPQGPEVYDFFARQFDSGTGRFLQIDPASQFASGYNGMGNNPVMVVDPDGRIAFLAVAAIAAKTALVGAGIGAVSYGLSTAVAGQSWNWGNFGNAIITGGVTGATTTLFGPFAGGALGGGIGSTIAGGSFGKGAILGLAGAGFGAIGLPESFGANLAMGIGEGAAIGALGTTLYGGDIGQGTLFGGITGGVFATATSPHLKNALKGQGFRSNSKVLAGFVGRGDYQGALDYFGFEGSFLPDDQMLTSDGTLATGKTLPNGEIGYSRLAFDSFDKLRYTNFKENFHNQRLGAWETWDYPQGVGLGHTKYYPEEAAGFLRAFKNQGLFLRNPMNYYSQINFYRSIYTDNIFKRRWSHFIYKIPRRY